MDLFGICISEGYAAGNACMYQKPTSVGSGIFAGVQEELQRFDTAKRLAKQQLLEALRRLSDNQAASELIQVQEMLLDDTEFSQAVRDQIDSGHCAGQAVTQAAASLADFFRAMDDSYMVCTCL
ncbi:MAG: phosphoenolpyruvate-utilizing N-terminal domain-containing protein [Oscillospiraceae bacterium]